MNLTPERNYNPVYQATYDGIIKAGVLGDVYHARLVWHPNGNWRRQAEMPTPDYDPSRWGVTRAPGRSSGAARIL